ncbi:MAG: hypothetical protein LBQ54_11400 [Planctomycetaceae bacterium]|jgi:hypothetical protein|nr:hypothetical protein [Planctomycetaceae bacterium]
MYRLQVPFILLVVPVAFITGCSDGKVEVTGLIRYEERIPEEGTIAFIGDNGAGTTYGGPYVKGKYKVRIPEGTFRVRITGRRMVPLDTPIPGSLGGSPITKREEKIIPDVYGLHSILQVEIDKSTRKHDFDLKAPKK